MTTTHRTTKLVLALVSVLAIWLSVPLAAHAKGTIGHSFEGSTDCLDPPAGQPLPPPADDCETPQITEFQMNAIDDVNRSAYDERAGAHPIINFWMRTRTPDNAGGLVWLSLIALALLVVSGWLGGKMVYVMRVAVTEEGETARQDVSAPMAREAARRA